MIFSFFCDLLYFLDQFSFSHIWHENCPVCTLLCIPTEYTAIYSIPFFLSSKTFPSTRFFSHSSQFYWIFFPLWFCYLTIFASSWQPSQAKPFVYCININYRVQSTLMLQLISSMNITSISLVQCNVCVFFPTVGLLSYFPPIVPWPLFDFIILFVCYISCLPSP